MGLAEAGFLSTAAALALAVYAALASAVGALTSRPEAIAGGRRALLGSAVLTALAVAALVAAFVRHDFSVQYVWQTSSSTTPAFYLLTGLWGGQSGSLLFWSFLLAGFSAVAAWRPWRADLALLPPFVTVCSTVVAFFLFLVVFVASPFERLTVTPVEGNGLNPLLQHPGMAFHPPTLYLGLTGMVIPYAFAMAALASGRLDPAWITASRRWLLVAWAFLSIGLSLGGRWAYDVLGWGGYWGWDPVENAALMPWLAGTAFLHSVMVQERRGMFRIWNMALVILVFALVIVGTFLTRAGIVSSVHSFAQSDIGPYFLAFTAAMLAASIALLWRRLPDLRDEARIESAVSREAAFLANNVVFLGALFGVFWGTLFPIVGEILTGQRVAVGPRYFNVVVLPILWVAVVLMAVAPLVGWRRADAGRVARGAAPSLAASLGIVSALVVLGVRSPVALAGLAAASFALLAVVVEIGRGVRLRMRRGDGPLRALATLVARQRRRYGGFVVHAGVALLAMGVVGTGVYQLETERSLAVGERIDLGGYTLTYVGLEVVDQPDVSAVHAVLDVSEGERALGTVRPRRDVFRLREDQPMTIPSILHRPEGDVYTLLGGFDPATERATVKAFVNPLVSFVWLGMLVIVVGALVAAWPDRREALVMDAEVGRLLGAAVPEPGATARSS